MEENTIRAGRIEGNPMTGLCERVVIQAERVYDGCVSRYPSNSYILTLSDITADLTYPYTYTNAVSSGDATFENVVVTPLEGNRVKIEGDVKLPVTVNFTDSEGVSGTASSTISIHRDIFMSVPSLSLTPYTIEVTGSLASNTGTFISDTTVSIVCCVVIVTKIIVKCDIVVPCYGQSVYPECLGAESDACSSLLNLPIFPPLD